MPAALDRLATLLGSVHAPWLAPFLACVLLHFLAEPLRWYVYLREDARPGYAVVRDIFSLTAFITYLVPVKMGLPVRVMLLRLRLGLGVARISSLLIVDGLLYYGLWAVAALAAIATAAGRASGVPERVPTFVGACALGLGAGLLAWRARRRLLPRGLRERLRARLDGRLRGLRDLGRDAPPHLLAGAALVIVADIASQVARHWAILAVLGISLSWAQVFLITSVSMFTGLVSLMPMGLGGYDAMLVLLLAHASVPAPVGVSAALLNRLGTVAVGAALGAWGGHRLGLSPFRRAWMKDG